GPWGGQGWGRVRPSKGGRGGEGRSGFPRRAALRAGRVEGVVRVVWESGRITGPLPQAASLRSMRAFSAGSEERRISFPWVQSSIWRTTMRPSAGRVAAPRAYRLIQRVSSIGPAGVLIGWLRSPPPWARSPASRYRDRP